MALGSSVCLWILSIGFYTIIEIVIVFVLTCWLGFQGSDRRQGGADCSQEASERPPPSSSPCVLLGCCSIRRMCEVAFASTKIYSLTLKLWESSAARAQFELSPLCHSKWSLWEPDMICINLLLRIWAVRFIHLCNGL